ncbi:hypothetical protein R3P38DRAFT_3335634 [Favolaschia claudopus]|uniref:Integrase core domain-containing protein n=1 Tax=Favolaschia claudopus TaxID=2862362 RepID=A0AAV9ZA42_9AGAR
MYGDCGRAHCRYIEESNVAFVEPVTVVRNGKRGRPQKVLNPTFVAEAMSSSRKITVTQLAKLMGISRPTLFKHLRANNLDALVRSFRASKPDSGLGYLVGFLRRHGLRVQRRRVYSFIHPVDGLGRALRQRRGIKRQDYRVSRAHALWHVDGHHKLILWEIVIHGFVDGYSRTVTALRASTNNRATTVLEVFLEAVGEYGLPSRVRGDHGAENKKVPVYMIITQGLGRASFMWGSSTHNTRIERLWVEAVHGLERSNPHHLWLLHLLLLDFINDDSEDFRAEWNLHPISGEGHGQTPHDLCFTGQVEKGVYMTEYPNIHPSILQRYYGVHGRVVERQPGETGADDEHVPAPSTGGADDDASDLASDDELVRQVEDAQAENFHHEPVAVPKHASPFEDDETTQLSHDALGAAEELEFVPRGFGLLREEWEEGVYPSYEILRSGRRGGKELRVALPDPIWRPRAERWGRALAILNEISYINEHA